jgi:ferredoxin
VARKRVKVYPDVCVNCKLCEKSCPVNAIASPAPRPGPRELAAAKRRLAWALALWPVLIAVGVWTVGAAAPLLARAHPDVPLARLVAPDAAARFRGEPGLENDELTAFHKSGRSAQEVYASAQRVRSRFAIGSRILGAWIGLVLGAKLVGLARTPVRTDYQAQPGDCVACGRCFDYCPKEYERLGAVAGPTQGPVPVPAPALATLRVEARSTSGAAAGAGRKA